MRHPSPRVRRLDVLRSRRIARPTRVSEHRRRVQSELARDPYPFR